ncbi:MAG: HlyD family secretion protein [Candidatus Levybacteria bacterium]|nr:HlyD family secretion protein [Candidatus Levybacteria bacterium]
MKKRIIMLSAVAVLIFTAVILFSYFRKNKISSIRTTGIVEGTEVNIASKVAGKISEIYCKEGDAVHAGSLVILLESNDLRAVVEQAAASLEKAKADANSTEILIDGSKAELNAARADVKNAEADVVRTKVQMEEAKRQMERITSLYMEGLASKADNDRAVTDYESLKAVHEASQAGHKAMLSRVEQATSKVHYSLSQLLSAKAGVKEAEAVLSLDKARLQDTIITSPISGIVVFKSLERGEFVSPGITMLTVVDMNNLWVRVDVEETVVGMLTQGNEVFITTEGMPKKVIKGRISEIGRYAEFATQRDVKHGRHDIKTFRVKIKTENPEKILKPGMTVDVEIPGK